ncbi:MAG: hypothetical protein ACI9TP_001040, partial [Candidatus Azotimanducaceae bacterium]
GLTADKVEYMGGDGGSLAHCFVSMWLKCFVYILCLHIHWHGQTNTGINLNRNSRITNQFLKTQ